MYYHMETIKDVSTNVLEPVAEQVVRYIISQIGFYNTFKDNIMFESINETTSKTYDANENRKLPTNKLICTINNILNPLETIYEGVNNTHITSFGFPESRVWDRYPNFSDIINKLFLFTMERPCNIQIECNFNFVDRTIAYEVGNRLFSQYTNGQTIPVMDVMFDYPIPSQMLTNLYIMYKMTKFYENPKNKFIDYLKEGSKYAITVKSNKFKKDLNEIVLQRTLHYCLVRVEFNESQVNADKKNKLPLKFNNQMTLTIQFMKPDDMIMSFPMIINNQLVPGNLIPEHGWPPQPPWLTDTIIGINNWNSAERERYKTQWLFKDRLNIIRVPLYDNWFPPSHPKHPSDFYRPFIIIAFPIGTDHDLLPEPYKSMAKDNETWIHLVNDIQKATGVSDEIIFFIKKSGNEIFYAGLDVLMVVYRDNYMLDQSNLRIVDDWLVITTDDPHKIHRVIIYTSMRKEDKKIAPLHTLTFFEIVANREDI